MCTEAKNMLTLFHVDFKKDRDIMRVIDAYPLKKEVILNERHSWNRLPVNILRGYKEAVKRSGKYVFMIEEDVMVGTDFFNWHYKVQSDNIFCSIASRNNNLDRNLELDKDPQKYYLSHLTYQSLGVCFNKKILEKYVFPHAVKDYFISNRIYCIQHFNSFLKDKWCEQAGLIRRIQERYKLPIAYPFVPRCYHAGFYGKNRKGNVAGSLKNKIDKLGRIIFSQEDMKKAALHQNYYDDSKPVELNQQKVDKIVLDNIKKL
jgi:hypothetical protein